MVLSDETEYPDRNQILNRPSRLCLRALSGIDPEDGI